MTGRNGADNLSRAVSVVVIVLLVVSLFFHGDAARVLWILAVLGMVYVYFRMFSRNHAARQREYYAFLRFWTPVEEWFRFQRTRFRERNTYKYFRCPQCKQRLRAPRGKGKIQVTCQKCRNVFQTKT